MSSQKLLSHKHIVVTGAHGLLGKEIAEQCLNAGATVTGLDLQDTKETSNHIKTIQCDLTDEIQMNKVILDLFNKSEIDGWVNAAYPRTKDWRAVEIHPSTTWNENIQMQLTSVCQTMQKVGAYMKERKIEGSIVSLASIYGVLGPQFDIYKETNMGMPAPYAAIKGGIINFSRFMASQLGPSRIRFNCISPGGIEDHQPQEFIENYSQRTMLKRMGHPEDIAPLATFLLSNQSSYITGQNIMVDGGWSSM